VIFPARREAVLANPEAPEGAAEALGEAHAACAEGLARYHRGRGDVAAAAAYDSLARQIAAETFSSQVTGSLPPKL
jgi:hypothetical protein